MQGCFCSHCEIVMVEDSNSELCQGCINEVLSYLFWEDTAEQEMQDWLERTSEQFDYASQFSLVSNRTHRL